MKYGEISSSGMVMRRRDKRVWYVVIGVFVAVFLFTFLTQRFKGADGAEAASLAEFDPGYIISDYQMGRYDAMSEAEIQAFLTKKNPCSNTNYNYYLSLSANKNYTWHWENGHFVCLSEERFGDGEVIGSGETAAHIIWQAAQDYKINPQALIVLLQKETSLITDPIPNNGDYRKATGYGCPDTAPCSSQYYGFKNQVRKAAALFRTVLDGGWTNYPLGNNYIQYNPNSGCGGSVVNIRSLATSALYRYTPYQPNAGAIAAGYGTAYCGAYGNRNFYLYFQDWFGGITNTVEVKKHRKVDPATPGEKQDAIIDDEEYIITSALDKNYAIDIYAGLRDSGANIQLYKKHGDENQRFKFVYQNNGFYEIVNTVSNKSLNVYGGWMDEETNVQLWDRDGSCASYWRVDKNADGSYSILSSCSDLVLDIYGGKIENGKNIQVYFSNGGNNQRWYLEAVEEVAEEVEVENGTIDESEYTITSASDTDYAIDIYGGINKAENGANIQLYSKHKDENQRFKFIYNEHNQLYEIVNPATNKSLNVYGARKTLETNVQLWDRDGSCASYFDVTQNPDGTYQIKSACSELVLDIYGGKALREKNIQIYTGHGGLNQKWILEK